MTTRALEYPDGWVRVQTLAVLVVIGAVSVLDRAIINLMVTDLKADLHISDFQISLLQGFSFAVVFGICGIPLGYAADRFSRRLIIWGGVVFWSLATTASAFASSFEQLLLARVLLGVGEAALAPAAYSLIGDVFPRQQLGRALAVYTCGTSLGAGAALALGSLVLTWAAFAVQSGSVLSDFRPWQLGFIMVGAPGVVLAFLAFLLPEPQRRAIKVPTHGTGPWPFIKRHWQFFLCHFIGFSCLNLLAYALVGWSPAILMRVYGWTVSEVGLVTAPIYAVASIVTLTTAGLVIDKLFARNMRQAHMLYFCIASIAAIACGGLLLVVYTPLAFIACVVLSFFAVTALPGGAAAIQIVTAPQFRGQVSAIYLLVVNLVGQGLGPSIVAFFTDFVFQDDQKIQVALATSFLTVAPIGMLCFFLGMHRMKAAVLDAEASGVH